MDMRWKISAWLKGKDIEGWFKSKTEREIHGHLSLRGFKLNLENKAMTDAEGTRFSIAFEFEASVLSVNVYAEN